MNMQKTLLTAAAGLLVTLLSVSGQSSKSPTPVRTSVGDVTDNRSTGSFFSECKVELKFTGDAAADAGTVRAIHIKEAVDELGRDLRPNTEEDAAARSFGTGRTGGALKTEVKLKNPSRNATTIKVLKGEVELFSPTEANGAIVRIKDVLKHPAEPIQNPALNQYGIQLMYLTRETYEAKKKELNSATSGTGGSQPGEAFGELFKGMFAGMMSNSRDAVQLYNKDPQKRVVELEFQDAQGKPLKTTSRWTSSDFQQMQLAAPPPADTQLVIQLAVPSAVKSFAFEIHDIPLP